MDGGSLNRSSTGSMTTVDFGWNGDCVADLSGKVHQLPCCIKYKGPTSVSHYFRPKPTGVEIDGLSVEEAYFRGRNLQGTTIPLPQGYSGFVLGKRNADKSAEVSKEDPNCWETNAKFDNMTIWNHDIHPSHDDAFIRAFHWFSVAKALHQTVSIQDLESECNEELK
ncbi:hypothetical protein M9H77_17541 [Catharanthus roseus]|uniref:Uncharacterized protein n=1 Tax=Catharanthus roseus TaxID=4058 RepID=A0ACC0B586_CATRO|nr:hypothetical protein M9H77_17541 [Catharanthus roseus]